MRTLRVAVLVAVLSLLGCATILTGTSQSVSFDSTPSGARGLINAADLGVTPLTTKIAKSDATRIPIREDGYADCEFVLQASMESWFWGNILLGGFVGSSTDLSTGATNRYEPNADFQTLGPLDARHDVYEVDREFAIRSTTLTLHAWIGRELATGQFSEVVGASQRVYSGLSLETIEALYFFTGDDSVLAFSNRIVDHWKGSKWAS